MRVCSSTTGAATSILRAIPGSFQRLRSGASLTLLPQSSDWAFGLQSMSCTHFDLAIGFDLDFLGAAVCRDDFHLLAFLLLAVVNLQELLGLLDGRIGKRPGDGVGHGPRQVARG